MNTEKPFTTTNIYISAYLLASDLVDLVEIARVGSKFEFRFTPYMRCLELQEEYFNGAELPAKHLFTHHSNLIRAIKNGDTNIAELKTKFYR